MRIIKESTLKRIYEQARYKRAEQAIRSWIYEVRFSEWENTAELKAKYKSAGIINPRRVVFNICGSSYRLVVDVEFQLKIVFVVWFGTHNEYDGLDVSKIGHEDKRD